MGLRYAGAMHSNRNSGAVRRRTEYAQKAYKECARMRRQLTAELLPLAKRTLREMQILERSVDAIATELMRWKERLDG